MNRRVILDFARLTLAKNRRGLWVLAAVFLASLPLGAWIGGNSGHPGRTGLEVAVILWAVAGLPLLAVFLGASTAEEVRSTPARESEALLPGSHLERALGALLGAAAQLALLAALVGAAGALLIPEKFPLTAALLLALPYLGTALLYSFVCVFAVGQGLLGVALGIGLAWLGLVGAGVLDLAPGGRGAGEAALLGLVKLGLHFGAPVAALGVAAGWHDRRLRGSFQRSATVAGLLAVGAAGTGWLGPLLMLFR